QNGQHKKPKIRATSQLFSVVWPAIRSLGEVWWSTLKKVYPSSLRRFVGGGIYSGMSGLSIKGVRNGERSYVHPKGFTLVYLGE
ncbi:hypothetical protein KC963_03565, partial [Candidatus Saccharibacteria bacterium]|nr:hypothetical protein [Candidatus Saccharibacteria bacterium]